MIPKDIFQNKKERKKNCNNILYTIVYINKEIKNMKHDQAIFNKITWRV